MSKPTPHTAARAADLSHPPGRPPVACRHVDAGHFRDDLARAARDAAADRPQTVFVVQVERLPAVARQCGRNAASALLDAVDRRLDQALGTLRVECRAGESRIAILKEGCGRRQANELGHRICAALDDEVFHWGSSSFRLSASVGVLEMEERPARIDDLLEQANEACEAAHSLGNEGVFVFSGRARERESLDLERDWREHLTEVLG